ncbi:hypothetical protein [Candidatus Poriferisodalis sp.]|uniref:hypothetical protein n=1 Tax=Candidatus Poriferisodalis sp. TaxID=3101277 RepID=UPI003D0BF2E7
MNYVDVHLQGFPIEDVFVYRTSLYAWTFDGDLIVFSINDIESIIRRELWDEPIVADGVCFLLFHSNRIGAKRFQYTSAQYLSGLGTDVNIKIDASLIPHNRFRTTIEADCLMDVMIYLDRMHLATDGGLFELDLPRTVDEWSNEIVLERTLALPCYCSAASLGALAASCGDEGLIVTFNNYESVRDVSPQRVLVAEQSQRLTYGSGGLFNFTGRSSYQYLNGEILDTSPSDDLNRRSALISLEPAHIIDSTHGQQLSDSKIDYVMFARRRLVFLSDGQVLAVSLDKDPLGRKSSQEASVLGYYDRNPISISTTRSMLIIESDEELVICAPDYESDDSTYVTTRWSCGPTIALRTFPMSRRYLDLAIRTSEAGTHFYGLIAASNGAV